MGASHSFGLGSCRPQRPGARGGPEIAPHLCNTIPARALPSLCPRCPRISHRRRPPARPRVQLPHRQRSVAHPAELAGAWPLHETAARAYYSGTLSIGPTMSIQVKVNKKTNSEKPPTLGKASPLAVAEGEAEAEEGAPGVRGGDAAREYFRESDPEGAPCVPPEDIIDGLRVRSSSGSAGGRSIARGEPHWERHEGRGGGNRRGAALDKGAARCGAAERAAPGAGAACPA